GRRGGLVEPPDAGHAAGAARRGPRPAALTRLVPGRRDWPRITTALGLARGSRTLGGSEYGRCPGQAEGHLPQPLVDPSAVPDHVRSGACVLCPWPGFRLHLHVGEWLDRPVADLALAVLPQLPVSNVR